MYARIWQATGRRARSFKARGVDRRSNRTSLGGHWGANGAFQKWFKNQCNDVACFAEPVTIPIPPNCWQCTYWCLPSLVTVKRCSRNTTPIQKHRSENSANPNPILAALQGMCALDPQPAKQHMSSYKSPTRKDRKDQERSEISMEASTISQSLYIWKTTFFVESGRLRCHSISQL